MRPDFARMAVERLARWRFMLLGRGRITLVTDDGPIQKIQAKMSAKETMDLLRMAEFGFTSWPPVGTDVAVIFLNGDRLNGISIGSNNQKLRFKLENEGEVAISDALGKSIWLKKDGGIVIEANNLPVEINHAKKVTINAGDDGVVLDSTGPIAVDVHDHPVTIDNAKKVTVNAGSDGFELTSTGAGVIDMGGANLTVQNVGTVKLDNPTSVILGPAGKKVVVDGDVVTAGHVVASQAVVKA